MKLGGQQASNRVEDRRGIGMVGGGLGVGTIVIALVGHPCAWSCRPTATR